MLDWLLDNSEALNLLISILMLIVWMIYLQVFYMGYARQKRPKVLINKAAGEDINAHCLICNMSAEAIYLSNIIVEIEDGDTSWKSSITDMQKLYTKKPKKTGDITHQGPLGSGRFFDIGAFKTLLEHGINQSGAPQDILERDNFSFKVMIIAQYGSEKLSIAAKRTFYCKKDEKLVPSCPETIQIRSILARRKIRKDLQETALHNV